MDESTHIATVTPDKSVIEVGAVYTITCSSGFEPKDAELVCGKDGSLSPQPSCKKSDSKFWVIPPP